MIISSNYSNYNYYKPQSYEKDANSSQFNTENSNEKDFDKKDQNSAKKEQQTQMINGVELTMKEVQLVRELQSIDRNVKAHEATHQAAGGGLAGAASFSYTKGPDNQMYATAGEVPIKMQKGNTPEETIAIARQVVAAAMAPSDPSPQDYKVAANATKMEIEARAEATKLKAEEAKEKNKEEEKRQEESEKKGFKEQVQKAYDLSEDSLGLNIAS
ncbi:putative metalloprotease CJM1_0395 family protein [Campylobacter upsaliensis]